MAKFTDLAAELKLDIFERIPARDIQRCRRVCKDFRDTIDANTSTLSRDICAREVARLQAKIDYVFDYDPSQVNFSEALRRWCNHRGICRSHYPRKQDLRQFVDLFLLKNCVRGGLQSDLLLYQLRPEDVNFQCPSGDDPEDILELLYGQLIDIAVDIVNLFGRHHKIEGFEEGRGFSTIKQSFLDRINFNIICILPGLDRDWADELFEAAIRPSRLFCAALRSMEEQEAVLLHMRPVTTLDVGPFRRNFARHRYYIEEHSGSACSMPVMTTKFGLPFLPRRGLGSYTVAYCVKNNWAGNELSWRELGDLEEGLEPLKKAAYLEDMLVY